MISTRCGDRGGKWSVVPGDVEVPACREGEEVGLEVSWGGWWMVLGGVLPACERRDDICASVNE